MYNTVRDVIVLLRPLATSKVMTMMPKLAMMIMMIIIRMIVGITVRNIENMVNRFFSQNN